MAWTLQKPEIEQKVDVRLSLPESIHTPLKQIADESGIELAEVIRQALAYSLKRYNTGRKKVSTAEVSEG